MREVLAYQKDGALCLFDGHKLIALPISSVMGFREIRNQMAITFHGYDEKYKTVPYEKAGVAIVRGGVTVPAYGVLTVEKDGDDYELLIPNYEIETLSALTGLKIGYVAENPKSENGEDRT